MPRRKIYWILAVSIVIMGIGCFLFSLPLEHSRISSPDGKYIAIAYYSASETFQFSGPGQGSDQLGTIRMETTEGEYLGEASGFLMQQLHDIRWGVDSASLPAYVDWDFKNKTFEYWNEDQTFLTKKQL